MAGAALALCRPPRSDREAEKQIVGAIDVAAEVLGNTRTVCRNCYVHPTVLSAYREGELVDRWKAARRHEPPRPQRAHGARAVGGHRNAAWSSVSPLARSRSRSRVARYVSAACMVAR